MNIMIEKINQLANGIVESEVAKLRVKPAYIDVQLMYGKENRLELEIQSLNHRYFKALAYTETLNLPPAQGIAFEEFLTEL